MTIPFKIFTILVMSLIVTFAGGTSTKLINHPVLGSIVLVVGLFISLYRRDEKIKK